MDLKMRVGAVAAAALLFTSGVTASAQGKMPPTAGDFVEKTETYKAELSVLNPSIAGNVSGQASIVKIGDKYLIAESNVQGLSTGMHVQHIHTGTSCPGMEADTNGDGLVDVIEGVPAYGPILIPLDSQLASQSEGEFPEAGEQGALEYIAAAKWDMLLEDLRKPDDNPDDAFVKLAEGENLNLGSRHVVIHGVPENTDLPDTVASLPGVPATATLPVACGELKLMSGR